MNTTNDHEFIGIEIVDQTMYSAEQCGCGCNEICRNNYAYVVDSEDRYSVEGYPQFETVEEAQHYVFQTYAEEVGEDVN
jgi:hypothetical protein